MPATRLLVPAYALLWSWMSRVRTARGHGRPGSPVASTVQRIRTLAMLTRWRGAQLGANDGRSRATSSHIQPLPARPSGTSGHIWHYPATLRKCLLGSRSRVRVAVGARTAQLNDPFRNYCHYDEVLLADNHSHVMWPWGTRRPNALTRQNCGPRACAVLVVRHREPNGKPCGRGAALWREGKPAHCRHAGALCCMASPLGTAGDGNRP